MNVKSITQFDAASRKEISDSYLAFVEANQAVWAEVQGVEVLRVHDETVVGCPCTGKKNSRHFSIIDIEKGEEVCQLSKTEVRGWLFKRWEEKQSNVPAQLQP